MQPLYSFYEGVYGQSWTRLPESDAFWRIYSPNKMGIRISTAADRFGLMTGVDFLHLLPVVYFDDEADLLVKARQHKRMFEELAFKRAAFRHEYEVRLFTHADDIQGCAAGTRYVSVELDPLRFVESIMLDPRAPEWFVETIQNCRRAGFPFVPVKSSLYAANR